MTPVIAILAKHATTDGLVEFNDDVPLGKAYRVDIDTRQTVVLFNIEHQSKHCKEIVQEIGSGCWLPLECLEMRVS
jgi:hypothetical protein